jgi:subfamily B ATP-binding cassette protein MsbA
MILGLFVVRGVATYVNDFTSGLLSGKVVFDLRAEMLDRILRFPSRYFLDNPASRAATSVLANVNSVTEAGFNIVTVVVKDGITVLGLIGLLFYTNWRLTLICLVILPLVGLGVRLAARKLADYARQTQASAADLMQTLTEIMSAQKIIKIYGAQQAETESFLHSAQRIRRALLKSISTSSANSVIVQFLVACAVALVVYAAGNQASSQSMTAGDFASFMTAMLMLLSPVKRLTNINQSLQRGLAAAEDIFSLIDTATEQDLGTHTCERVRGHIRFNTLSFAYREGAPHVIDQLDLDIPAGTTLGIVGESGGGKSTLISLIPRFLEKTAGGLAIDGVDVSDWQLASLRRQIAIVTQESHLFNDTVLNNIAYGEMASAPREAVIEAARMANALDFIEQLPKGFDTLLGDAGIRLSGGQRQRIAIARAFLKNAPILIFDEATSSLDNVAEREVQLAMERLASGRTTLVVAHRLSTLVNVDRIIVLSAGRIVESGSHAELLAAGAHYARLYQLQFAQ